MARFDLLDRVVVFKSRFFSSAWAHYDRATVGGLRLAPPAHRVAELTQDYAKMEPMFLAPPPRFDEVIASLHDAETQINALRDSSGR